MSSLDLAVSTAGLTRRFGPVTAVDHLDLDVAAGSVTGLVGPNGSGKSTLIRMLLGLITPTSGTATVLGEPIGDPSRYAGRVGALVEGPAFVATLSARDNLRSLCALRRLPGRRVDEVLEVVGLHGRDREAVGRFSLGMKQRLGIAAALLPDPELLVLDEPTNGLDPAGIVEIRILIRQLGASGRTVIVSSHLLAELQAACDHLAVIRFGELLFSGSVGELIARQRTRVDLAPEHDGDAPRLASLLDAAGWDVDLEGSTVRVAASADDAAALNRLAGGAGVTLRVLAPASSSLEDVFLDMTGTTDGELAAARARQADQLQGALR